MKKTAAILISLALLMLSACADNAPTRASGFAMDTEISVTVYGDSATAGRILRSVCSLENKISWSIDGSDTYILNQSGSVESETLADIITATRDLCNATDGQYSLAVRELCALWDINSGEKIIPSDNDIAAVLSRTGGIPTVNKSTIALTDGSAIDLGSVGKGAACDIAAQIFAEDSSVGIAAIGSSLALCGDKPNGEQWTVSVAQPDNINQSAGTLYLDGGVFVSTSSDSQRGFERDGIRYHHIINAVSGYPVNSGLRSVTVIADSGVLSDALSTACFIVGYEKSLELLAEYNAQAVFITDSGEVISTSGLTFEVAK